MTTLRLIRAAQRRQPDTNALSRLVWDAQREAAGLLARIETPAILRVQQQLADITEPMRRTQEQMERVFGEPARRLKEQLMPSSRVLTAMQEMYQPSRALEQFRSVTNHSFNRVGEAIWMMEEPTRRLREQMDAITGPLERINDFVKQLDPTWIQSAQELAEQVRWGHMDRRVAKLLLTRGWLGVERHLDDAALERLLKIRGCNKGAGVDRAICLAFRRNRYALLKAMVTRWKNVTYLRDRMGIIAEAVAAHRERRYRLSIPALLPLVDGLAAEIRQAHPHLVRAKGKKGKPNLGEVVTDIVKVYDTNGRSRDYADAVIAAVSERVFKEYHFATDPAPSTLNRHGILHGRISGYASAVNSLRAFLLIDVMAFIAEELE